MSGTPTWRRADHSPAGTRRGRDSGRGVARIDGIVGWLIAAVGIVPTLLWRPLSSALLGAGWWPRPQRSTRAATRRSSQLRVRGAPAPSFRRAALAVIVCAAVAWSIPAVRVRVQAALVSAQYKAGFRLAAVTDTEVDLVLDDPVPADLEAYHPSNGSPQAAHADDPWFVDSDYSTGQGFALDPRIGWRHVNPYRFLDIRTSYVNVVDGRRVTWQAPACSCRRLTVWMYGGSTTWGLDQRDEGTIASFIAKTASADGLVVDVQNRGETGHLHWMEAERFAWDLTADPPPDLVIFYDGVNDVWAATGAGRPGSGAESAPIDPTLRDLWAQTNRLGTPPSDVPSGASFPGGSGWGDGGEQQAVDRVMDMYNRARRVSRATAEQAGVPIRYFWQPARATRPIQLDEPHDDASLETGSRRSAQLLQRALSDDVVDLTDVLDDVSGALFTDDVHHNERAAEVIGSAIYGELKPRLTQLLAEGNTR